MPKPRFFRLQLLFVIALMLVAISFPSKGKTACPTWEPHSVYYPGDCASYNGCDWIAIMGHFSNYGTEPGQIKNEWELLGCD